jgi:hypothetical protein
MLSFYRSIANYNRRLQGYVEKFDLTPYQLAENEDEEWEFCVFVSWWLFS